MAQTLLSQRVPFSWNPAGTRQSRLKSELASNSTRAKFSFRKVHSSFIPEAGISGGDLHPAYSVRAGGLVVPRQEAGDPFGLLLRQRIVFLGNQVDDFTADAVISQLLLLDAQDPKKVCALFDFLSYFFYTERFFLSPGIALALGHISSLLVFFSRTSSCSSTPQVDLLPPAWGYTTLCKCVALMLVQFVWASQPQWVLSYWPLAQKVKELLCLIAE